MTDVIGVVEYAVATEYRCPNPSVLGPSGLRASCLPPMSCSAARWESTEHHRAELRPARDMGKAGVGTGAAPFVAPRTTLHLCVSAQRSGRTSSAARLAPPEHFARVAVAAGELPVRQLRESGFGR